MKTITTNLANELALDSTTLCRLWKVTVNLPGSASPAKTIYVTDHDQDIAFSPDYDLFLPGVGKLKFNPTNSGSLGSPLHPRLFSSNLVVIGNSGTTSSTPKGTDGPYTELDTTGGAVGNNPVISGIYAYGPGNNSQSYSRIRIDGASFAITNVQTSGTTNTITAPGHTFNVNDQVALNGLVTATWMNFSNTFSPYTITGVSGNTFTFTYSFTGHTSYNAAETGTASATQQTASTNNTWYSFASAGANAQLTAWQGGGLELFVGGYTNNYSSSSQPYVRELERTAFFGFSGGTARALIYTTPHGIYGGYPLQMIGKSDGSVFVLTAAPDQTSNDTFSTSTGKYSRGSNWYLSYVPLSGTTNVTLQADASSGTNLGQFCDKVGDHADTVFPRAMAYDATANCMVFLMSDGSLKLYNLTTHAFTLTASPVSSVNVAQSILLMTRATGSTQTGLVHPDRTFFLWYASGDQFIAAINASDLTLNKSYDLTTIAPPFSVTEAIADCDYDASTNTLYLTTAFGTTDAAKVEAVTLTTSAPATYAAAGGFTASAVEHKSDGSVDNMEITHFLDSDLIAETDLRAGLYDYADVELRIVSWAHPEYGSLKVIKGTLGQVSMKNGMGNTELRGLTQRASTVLASTFGPMCRAELFDGKLSSSGSESDPGNHWKCRKDPTNYTSTRIVSSSPDALTVIPTIALSTPALPSSNNTGITLNGVLVNAAFFAHTTEGGFDLKWSGSVGAPALFTGGGPITFAATATGNSLMFNMDASDTSTDGPDQSSDDTTTMTWAVLNSVGKVVSYATPWNDAVHAWEMCLYGQFYVPAAGPYTFAVSHDDGIMFAFQPTSDHPADLVTVDGPWVSNNTSKMAHGEPPDPLFNTKTAYCGYSFSGNKLAANNNSGSWNDTWTVHFPAAGTYNFEFDYTNWKDQQHLWITVQGQGKDGMIAPGNPDGATDAISGWYDNGLLRFTSGAMKDWSFDVQTYDTTSHKISLFPGNPMPYVPAPGDTFTMQTGCNKLIGDCKYKYNNVPNFQGENQMPGQLVMLQTPDTIGGA